MLTPQKRTAEGIGFLLIGILIFSGQDLILKLISGAYPLHEAMTIRSLTAIPVLLAITHFESGLRSLLAPGWRKMLVRGGMNFVAYTTYYLALAALPIATTVSLYFTAPLFITFLSIYILGERVTALKWGALLLGFAGVLIMVRPGSSLFAWSALLPVFAGLAYGSAMIFTRHVSTSFSASAMAFHSNLTFLAGALILSLIFGTGQFDSGTQDSLGFLTRGWAWPAPRDLLGMMACGIIASAGLTLLTQAYRIAEASAVAPFEYSMLIWGVVNGWIFWHDWPDLVSWVGIATLIAAGLLVLYSDRTNLQRAPT